MGNWELTLCMGVDFVGVDLPGGNFPYFCSRVYTSVFPFSVFLALAPRFVYCVIVLVLHIQTFPRDRLSSHSSMRLRHKKLYTEFPLVALTRCACAWREMWNYAAMAQQAGTSQNSQPSWSKGLKHSGLYYEGIVDDCDQVLELHRRSTMSTFGTRTSYRAQSKSVSEEDTQDKNKDKVIVATL